MVLGQLVLDDYLGFGQFVHLPYEQTRLEMVARLMVAEPQLVVR